jgi:outer membrane protein, heavy metal efflux system
MKLKLLCGCVAWIASTTSPGLAQVLRLEDVLESARRHYPPLLAALAEQGLAGGELLTALGKFDLTLLARLETDQLGFYKNERASAGFQQSLQSWGMGLYGGWRLGEGSFAPYDGKLDTRSSGEWSGGLKLPLLRDRAIDEKRAGLRRAEIGRRLASLSIEQQQLIVVQMATRRYWDWVAAGNRSSLADALLNIALLREHFLRESVEAGQIAAIEVTENARAILQRRSLLVEADRGLQEAAINLSLFFRDSAGNPVIPRKEQVPDGAPEPAPIEAPRMLQDIEKALLRRPDLLRLEAQATQLEVERQLALNDQRAQIDFQLGFTAEAGQGLVRRGPSEVKGGVFFELPFQRRAATGKLKSAEAKLAQISQRQRFARDQISAEIRDAASAVQAARERVLLLQQEIKVARELEEAERTRFQLGDGTLFLVNLREQATADASNREIVARNDYFRARAQYDFAAAATP